MPWSDHENSGPMEDLDRAARLVGRSGLSAQMVIGDSETMWVLIRNEEIQKLLDIKDYNMGMIEPEVRRNGLNPVGRLAKRGLELFSYDAEYVDTDNVNPDFRNVKPGDEGFVPKVYPMVPRGKVLVIPRANFPARMLYAVIYEESGSYARPRVPVTWSQVDPFAQFVKISSRPLPCPMNLVAWVRHTETCIKTLNKQKAEEAAFRSAVMLLFTQRAESGDLSSDVIASHASVLLPWAAEIFHQIIVMGCKNNLDAIPPQFYQHIHQIRYIFRTDAVFGFIPKKRHVLGYTLIH